MKRMMIIVIGFFAIFSMVEAAEMTHLRWASGECIAINTTASPNTIVIKAKNYKGQEMIVGGSLASDTEIKINGKKANIGDIKNGDNVDMKYERNNKIVIKTINIKR